MTAAVIVIEETNMQLITFQSDQSAVRITNRVPTKTMNETMPAQMVNLRNFSASSRSSFHCAARLMTQIDIVSLPNMHKYLNKKMLALL